MTAVATKKNGSKVDSSEESARVITTVVVEESTGKNPSKKPRLVVSNTETDEPEETTEVTLKRVKLNEFVYNMYMQNNFIKKHSYT